MHHGRGGVGSHTKFAARMRRVCERLIGESRQFGSHTSKLASLRSLLFAARRSLRVSSGAATTAGLLFTLLRAPVSTSSPPGLVLLPYVPTPSCACSSAEKIDEPPRSLSLCDCWPSSSEVDAARVRARLRGIAEGPFRKGNFAGVADAHKRQPLTLASSPASGMFRAVRRWRDALHNEGDVSFLRVAPFAAFPRRTQSRLQPTITV